MVTIADESGCNYSTRLREGLRAKLRLSRGIRHSQAEECWHNSGWLLGCSLGSHSQCFIYQVRSKSRDTKSDILEKLCIYRVGLLEEIDQSEI